MITRIRPARVMQVRRLPAWEPQQPQIADCIEEVQNLKRYLVMMFVLIILNIVGWSTR